MCTIDDINFDDYAVDIAEEYINNDIDIVELQQHEKQNDLSNQDTNILFE